MEASRKTHRPHIKVGKDAEEEEDCYFYSDIHVRFFLNLLLFITTLFPQFKFELFK